MKVENIRYEFPEMPEEIRNMIRNRVEEQIRIPKAYDRRYDKVSVSETEKEKQRVLERGRYRRKSRTVIAILVAVLAVGTTAMAAVHFYRMNVEKLGKYGTKVSVDMKNTVPNEGLPITAESEEMEEKGKLFINPTVRATWIPEGFVEADNGYRFHQEGDFGSGGISIVLWDANDFEITDTYVEAAEEIKIGEYDAVYIKEISNEGRKSFNHGMYISYPEAELVVQLYLHTVISREDAIRFAEGLVLTEKDADDSAMMQKAGTEETEEYIRTIKFEVSANEMSNMHQIGEWLVLPEPFTAEGSGNTEVSARVAAVQVLDHISGLETAYMEDNVSEQADEEGKLLPNVIQYIKCGDGINTLDEVLYTEEIDQCMIYATVEYKNTGDTVLENEPFYVCLMRIQETDEAYTILKRKPEKSISGYDRIVSSAMASDGRMVYYDVQGGDSNGRNYIERLEPGETATVHMGFLANKDELDYLYLDLSGGGSAYEFSEESLKVGYVDIRGVK